MYREANRVADGLASMGCEQATIMVVHGEPPEILIRQLVRDDIMGVNYYYPVGLDVIFL